MKEPERVFLEVGPGQTLSTLTKLHRNGAQERVVLSSTRHAKEQGSDVAHILEALGRLWLAGVQVDWAGFCKGERRHRVPLPTYPFERQRYWVELGTKLREYGISNEVNNQTSRIVAEDDANLNAKRPEFVKVLCSNRLMTK